MEVEDLRVEAHLLDPGVCEGVRMGVVCYQALTVWMPAESPLPSF